jgi:heme/copper-type cytochrome/quinol oxidase subunit 4
MLANSLRYWISYLLISMFVLFAVSFYMPDSANAMAGIMVVLGLSIVTYFVVQKHVHLHRQEQAPKTKTVKNILFELTGILLAMLVAGVLGKIAVETVTREIGDEMIKLIVGILIGMLTGLGVGLFVRWACGRFVEIVA